VTVSATDGRSDALWLVGGRVIDPATGFDGTANVLVAEGRIGRIAAGPDASDELESARAMDCTGLIVTPGLIDMHVHLREPGREDEETIQSAAAAAQAGGFTAVVAMPNTDPATDSRATVEFVLAAARGAPARVYTTATVTVGRVGKRLVEMAELAKAGAVGFTDDGDPVPTAGLMRRALEYAKTVDRPIISHAETPSLSGSGVMHEGRVSTVLGLTGIPGISEELAIRRDILLAEYVGARLHILHVSTAGGVAAVREAKARGVGVTCEATPHHFTLTDEAVRGYDANAKMNPPLRSEADRAAILEGLRDGTIDAVATDHAPHAPEEKACEFDAAAFGIVGLETCLGLVKTQLIDAGVLDWPEAIAKLTTEPARILGLEGGTLREGAPADMTLIDPEAAWTVEAKALHSRSRNTPFDGWQLSGRAVATLLGGRLSGELPVRPKAIDPPKAARATA
jgi:dihydroorotase